MGSREIEKALGGTLDAVESGETTLEEALSRNPALRAELEPLVALAMELRSIPRITAPDILRGRGRPVFASRPVDEPPVRWWRKLRLPAPLSYGWASTAVRAAAAFAVVLTLGSGTLVVSAGSLPEEPLYPVKLAMENVQLAITQDSGARAQLEMQFAARRLQEVAAAVQQGKPEAVEQGLALYQERVENAFAESAAVQQGEGEGEDQRLQEALKSNQEVLQRILSEEEKIGNPRARAAIDAAAQRTIERSEGLKQLGRSEQQPGAAGEKAPEKPENASDKSEKANPSSDAPGQQRSVAPPSDSAIDIAGHQPAGEVKGVRENPAGAGESEPAGAGKEKRIN
jgi:hypothetical protein